MSGVSGFFVFFAGLIVATLLLLGAILFPIIEFSRGVDHRSCLAFGKESERQVRFVEYTYFKWDCLTPTADGKWISTSRLREF